MQERKMTALEAERDKVRRALQQCQRDYNLLAEERDQLRTKQAWIDDVGPAHHPDDERGWCGAYLDMREARGKLAERLRVLEKALKDVLDAVEWAGYAEDESYCPVCGAPSFTDHMKSCEVRLARAALDQKEETHV